MTGNQEEVQLGQIQNLHEVLTMGLLLNMEMNTESQTVDTTLRGEAWDTGKLVGMLRDAAAGQGNFGIGSATAE